MGVLFGLCSAIAYGASDFLAGVAGRKVSSQLVAALSQPIGLVTAIVAVLALRDGNPTVTLLAWGACAGVGSGVGTLALYHGLAVGRMSVVAPISAVLAAALPAVVGLSTGDHLRWWGLMGLVLAFPAIALVSRQPAAADSGHRAGVVDGIVAGAGFGVLFICLAKAGTSAGAWPLVPAQIVAIATVVGFGVRGMALRASEVRATIPAALAVGSLGGAANLLFLAATGRGQLAVVAVLTSLYPAVTVLLARTVLHESWARVQAVGLVLAVLAVGLISAG